MFVFFRVQYWVPYCSCCLPNIIVNKSILSNNADDSTSIYVIINHCRRASLIEKYAICLSQLVAAVGLLEFNRSESSDKTAN